MYQRRFVVPIMLVAALAGCGGSGSGDTSGTASETRSGAAAAASSGASSAAADGSGSAGSGAAADAPAPAGTLDAAVLGARMGAAAEGKKTVTLRGEGAEQLTCGVRYGAALAESCSLSLQGKLGHFVLAGGAMYLDIGEKIKGKSWLKIDLKGSDPISQAMAPVLTSLQQSANPRSMAAAVKGLTVTASPGEDVEGTPTVAYQLSMNSQQMVAAMPAAQRKLVGSVLAGMTSRTVFYVDAGWLPRKVIVTTTVKGKATTQSLLYSDWGGPVSIVLPPASDVTTSMM